MRISAAAGGPDGTLAAAVSDSPTSTADTAEADATQFSSAPLPPVVSRRMPRRRGWLTALAGMVAFAAVGWMLARSTQSPDQAASRAAPPPASWITAPVEFRVLSSELIVRGDVRFETQVPLSVPLSVSGDAVVSASGPPVASAVGDGDRVAEISGRPVFVVRGATPAFRSLQPGMSGADVVELQDALTRLGFPVIEAGFGEATKSALASFYASSGYSPVPVSPTGAEDVAAATTALWQAQGALDDAQVAVRDASSPQAAPKVAADTELAAATRGVGDAGAAAADAVYGAQISLETAQAAAARAVADPASTADVIDQANLAVVLAGTALDDATRSGASSVATARERMLVAQAAVDDLANSGGDSDHLGRVRDQAAVARDAANAALLATIAANGPTVPLGEFVFVPDVPVVVQQSATVLGPIVDPSGVVARVAFGPPMVTAFVAPADVGFVHVGDAAVVGDASASGVPVVVASVASAASSAADGSSGFQVTFVAVPASAASSAGAAAATPTAVTTSSAPQATTTSVNIATGSSWEAGGDSGSRLRQQGGYATPPPLIAPQLVATMDPTVGPRRTVTSERDAMLERTNTTSSLAPSSQLTSAVPSSIGELTALVGSNVRVAVTTAATSAAMLVVPVAAITMNADGSTKVSVLPADASTPFDVPVIAGMSAGGFVAVASSGPRPLVQGDSVVVGR